MTFSRLSQNIPYARTAYTYPESRLDAYMGRARIRREKQEHSYTEDRSHNLKLVRLFRFNKQRWCPRKGSVTQHSVKTAMHHDATELAAKQTSGQSLT